MRLFRATVALCALLPLTACAIVVPPLHSPTPTPLPDPVTTSKSAVPQEVAEEQHPQKDVTVGEFLNAGLYHPESNAFGTFRPCTEISAEQWQELGWNVEDSGLKTGKGFHMTTSLREHRSAVSRRFRERIWVAHPSA